MMSLTDEQLTQVQQAAALLAPYERDFFLKSVANYLRDPATRKSLPRARSCSARSPRNATDLGRETKIRSSAA
jgi:hypothetical protein